MLDNDGPLFDSFVVDNFADKIEILFFGPGSLPDGGVEEARPVLPALFGAPVDFVWVVMEEVEFFGDLLPVVGSDFPA